MKQYTLNANNEIYIRLKNDEVLSVHRMFHKRARKTEYFLMMESLNDAPKYLVREVSNISAINVVANTYGINVIA